MHTPHAKNHLAFAALPVVAAPAFLGASLPAFAQDGRTSSFVANMGHGGIPKDFKIEGTALGRLRDDRSLFNWPETQSVLQKPVDGKAAVDALAQMSPLINQLRQWRGAMRGQGQVLAYSFGGKGIAIATDGAPSSRAFRIGVKPLAQYSLAGINSFGQQTPGIEISWNNFSFGMTQPLTALNKAMSPVDSILDGKLDGTRAPINESSLMWLAMKPLSGKSGQFEMMMVKGRRDLMPWSNEGKTFSEGQLMGAKGNLALTSRWKLAAEWMNSRSEDQKGESATAWKMAMDGPIKHPLGETRVSFFMNSTDAEFAPFTGNNSGAGQTQTHLDLQQGINKGKLTGNLAFAYDKMELPAQQAGVPLTAGVTATDAVQRTTMDANADFRLALSPKMSITARASHRDGALDSGNSNITATTGASTTADFGLDWKLSKKMGFTLTAGRTALENTQRAGENFASQDRTENRLTATLQKRTAKGAWGLTWQQNSAVGDLGGDTDAKNTTLSLEAERTLAKWLRVRSTMRLSNSSDKARLIGDEAADRNFEAYVTLPKYGNFAFRFSDWSKSGGVFDAYTLQTATKETSIRYNTPGSSRLGVTVEYLQREQLTGKEDAHWKVGVTLANK